MNGKPTMKDYLSARNETFRICAEGQEPVPAELVSVTDLGPRPSSTVGDEDRAFSLIFLTPLLGPNANQYLPQRIYRIEHERLGGLDTFIVPLGPANGKMQYEAIFN